MNIDAKITDILTLPTGIMAALSLSSGLVLFLPNSILEKMYMLSFRAEYGFILGLVFLLFSCILLVNLLANIFKFIDNSRKNKFFEENAEKKLMNLDLPQKAVIYRLYMTIDRTEELPIHSGLVVELEQNFMITKTTNTAFVNFQDPRFPYYLQPWVTEKLNSNRELRDDFRSASNSVASNLQ